MTENMSFDEEKVGLRDVLLPNLQIAELISPSEVEVVLEGPLFLRDEVLLSLLEVSVPGVFTDHIEQDLSIDSLVHLVLHLCADDR